MGVDKAGVDKAIAGGRTEKGGQGQEKRLDMSSWNVDKDIMQGRWLT